jgi:1,4-alpha-glucan branching enzyme
MDTPFVSPLESSAALLLEGRLHDPRAWLGLHRSGAKWEVRVFLPRAQHAWLETASGLEAFESQGYGLWLWRGAQKPTHPYRLRIDEAGVVRAQHDAYAFPITIAEDDLYLLNQGKLTQAYRTLGAHLIAIDGVSGVRFAVWAPNAERVSVVGDFNVWDGRAHPMQNRGGSGVWELFIPGLAAGCLYKYELRSRPQGALLLKSDPYANRYELRPGTASEVSSESPYAWSDRDWIARRAQWDWLHGPCNVYEVHVGSWKRHPDGRPYSYLDLVEHLVPYALEMGYTHIELLPISEHPLDESWGYQTTGYFAASRRYGDADGLRALVDACHRAGIGVILDWVPAHFPTDAFALARFDGTALYEHEDPRLGFHQDWGTHIFNYGRSEVRSFLLSSAHYWLSEFHLDGLRVDAVASMLYLDYSRQPGEWIANRYGGRENLDAIDFLRELNVMVHQEFPGALTFAEESTSWPAVSRPTYLGGLGFSMKWNMGWMNDTLRYMCRDPVYRRFHHNELTFGQLYAYTENFVLPFSHDEVVHGKGSLLGKMPGDAWQQFANLRLLLTYQMTTPGKKLNFMGNEFAQGREWSERWELDWSLLSYDYQRGVQQLAKDLNRLYRVERALHDLDFSAQGFSWIDCHDADQSILTYLRWTREGDFVVVALNFTPLPRHRYRIGVPRTGRYRELINSDSAFYAGSNVHNGEGVDAQDLAWMEQPCSMEITLPPLGGVIFRRVSI